MIEEIKYYGFNTCMALWRHRPQDIIRVYLHQERLKDLGGLLKWCATHKKAYHIISDDDLAKVAAATHHEGVIILGRAPHLLNDDELLEACTQRPKKDLILLLDDVQNPHNIGALMRSAAHFGAWAIIGASSSLPALSPSAMRVAEGGLEHIKICPMEHPSETVAELQRMGYAMLGTSASHGSALYSRPLPPRSIIALGNEQFGLSPAVLEHCDGLVRIPGTGSVESLNVSVAGALIFGEWWRQYHS